MLESKGILMHKDVRVAEILFVDAHPVEVVEIESPEHLPPGVSDAETFVLWLEGRNMSYTRPFSDELFAIYHIKSGSDFAGISHNASLTDCYWFADPEELDNGTTWNDINPRNGWSESGEYMFIGHPEAITDLESPDYATGGYLPKVWVKNPDNIFLLKRDGANGLNVYAEVAASDIAELMNISHVPYFYSVTAGEICSGCPCLITSDEEELVPFGQLVFQLGGVDKIEPFLTDRGMLGEFSRMQVFDFLIGNWNRSLDDFGVVRNPDTFEIYGMAPLYDHGEAFMHTENDEELRKMMRIAKKYVGAMSHLLLDKELVIEKMKSIAVEIELPTSLSDPLITRLSDRIDIYNRMAVE